MYKSVPLLSICFLSSVSQVLYLSTFSTSDIHHRSFDEKHCDLSSFTSVVLCSVHFKAFSLINLVSNSESCNSHVVNAVPSPAMFSLVEIQLMFNTPFSISLSVYYKYFFVVVIEFSIKFKRTS